MKRVRFLSNHAILALGPILLSTAFLGVGFHVTLALGTGIVRAGSAATRVQL